MDRSSEINIKRYRKLVDKVGENSGHLFINMKEELIHLLINVLSAYKIFIILYGPAYKIRICA